jgi:hypothetical protein
MITPCSCILTCAEPHTLAGDHAVSGCATIQSPVAHDLTVVELCLATPERSADLPEPPEFRVRPGRDAHRVFHDYLLHGAFPRHRWLHWRADQQRVLRLVKLRT